MTWNWCHLDQTGNRIAGGEDMDPDVLIATRRSVLYDKGGWRVVIDLPEIFIAEAKQIWGLDSGVLLVCYRT